MGMNNRLKGLYDMSNMKDNTLSKYEEQQLRKQVMNDKKLFAKNSDLFAEDKRFHSCILYSPCHICHKCLNKASHLYVRCQNCGIPICTHKHKDRLIMIKRKNFTIKANKHTINQFKKLDNNINSGD